MAKKLRSGYTTGACAAAAAKAAAICVVAGTCVEQVEIPFPDGSRVQFSVLRAQKQADYQARAVIKKDAGDDPDVTNRAEIAATVEIKSGPTATPEPIPIDIAGGEGVGLVTKRGLSVEVGEPAINPVPRQMIKEAVREALSGRQDVISVKVTISVAGGERLAEKTLNKRLGIIGGISILGTTGIVRPVSAAAWTATIKTSMDVARAADLEEIVISTGRTSERAVQQRLNLPEEALAMMGDYVEFSLLEAKRHKFKEIHFAGMWAKIIKAALEIPQTHVRHGALDVEKALDLLNGLGAEQVLLDELADSNTAREIYERLEERGHHDLIRAVCLRAREYARKVSGTQVHLYLVHSSKGVVEHV